MHHIRGFIAWLCLLGFQPALALEPDLIVLELKSAAAFGHLSQLLTDLEPPKAGLVRAYADAKQQAHLQALGWDFQVEIKNLTNFYRRRAAHSRRSLGASMGGFRTFAEIEQVLDWLSANFPAVISEKFAIGHSVEGRALWALRLSDKPNYYEKEEPTVWFDALHHAREPMSAEALLRFAYDLAKQYEQNGDIRRLIQSRNIILLPCANPDGYVFNQTQHPQGGGLWRKNRRLNADGSYGVDLNRNYSWQWGQALSASNLETYPGTAAFSEPETAAIRDFLLQQPPSASVSVHAYGNEWMFPWGAAYEPTADDALLRHYAQLLVAENAYVAAQATDLYGLTFGASDDYHYAEHGSLAYTVEIGNNTDGFWPDPDRIPVLFAAVQASFQQIAQWAGAWAVWQDPVWQQVSADHWQLQLQLENQGLMPLLAQISLNSADPAIEISGGQSQINLAPQTQQKLLVFDLYVKADLYTGLAYPLVLQLDYEGVSSQRLIPLGFGADLPKLAVLGKATAGSTLQVLAQGLPLSPVTVFWSFQGGTARTVAGIAGFVYLDGEITPLLQGNTDKNGLAQWALDLPKDIDLQAKTVYLQALFGVQSSQFIAIQFE